MIVYILRGLPGASKSTWAQWFKDKNLNTIICCADDHFMIDGEYKFNAIKIGDAHKDCFAKFMEALKNKCDHVIVANTNIRLFEMAPYITVANYFGYEHQIIEFPCDVETAVSRNVHNVPRSVIENMAKRWEKPLKSWNSIVYTGKGPPL